MSGGGGGGTHFSGKRVDGSFFSAGAKENIDVWVILINGGLVRAEMLQNCSKQTVGGSLKVF
jgi:hypothetical protein